MKPTFTKSEIHEKKWGKEFWADNNSEYCGKILEFKKGCSCSLHYHILKRESFIIENKFEFTYIDTDTAEKHTIELNTGDVVHIPRGSPHQMKALEDNCRIIEFSTQHFESDSHRIEPGVGKPKV